MIKLSDDDKVINVDYSNNTDLFVATKNGYGLWYDVESVSVVGIRASGVKSIKLKDDEVVSSQLFDSSVEYITIITDKGTAKRLKLSELEKTTRGNRGILLMKEIKKAKQEIPDFLQKFNYDNLSEDNNFFNGDYKKKRYGNHNNGSILHLHHVRNTHNLYSISHRRKTNVHL